MFFFVCVVCSVGKGPLRRGDKWFRRVLPCVCVCERERERGRSRESRVRRPRPDLGCWATKNKDNALCKGEWSVSSSVFFADEIRPQTPIEDEDGFQNWCVRSGGRDKSLFPARNITTIARSSSP
jgi:hypothetical protein